MHALSRAHHVHKNMAHAPSTASRDTSRRRTSLAEVREGLELADRRKSEGLSNSVSLTEAGIEHRFREKPALRRSPAARGGSAMSLFADRDLMKEQLRARLFKEHYDVKKLYQDRGCSQAIARSQMFDRLQLLLIVLNTFWLGIDTEWNTRRTPLANTGDTGVANVFFTPRLFTYVANAFCIFFLFEILIRLNAFKVKRQAFSDSWFRFDFFLVVLMVVETWVFPLYFHISGDESSSLSRWSTILRLLRFARVARFVRLIGVFPELLILFRGMFAAIRSMFFTLVILVMLAYVCAIGFKLSFPDCPHEDLDSPECRKYQHFRHLPAGMLSLAVQGTLLDNVGNLVDDLVNVASIHSSWWLPLGFLAYVFLSAFTVLNLLIGVICEAVSSVAVVYREETQIEKVTDRLESIIIPYWLNGDPEGKISKNMLAEMLMACENDDHKPGIASSLHKVGVDIIGLVDIADTFFDDRLDSTIVGESALERESGRESKVLTFNFEQRELTFAELMEIVLNLRGSNTVTVKDLVHHRKLLSRSQSTLVETLHGKIQEQLRDALHEFGIHRRKSMSSKTLEGGVGQFQQYRMDASDSPVSSGARQSLSSIEELPREQIDRGGEAGKAAAASDFLVVAPSLAPVIAASIARAEESLREARAKLDEIFAETERVPESKEPRSDHRGPQKLAAQWPLAQGGGESRESPLSAPRYSLPDGSGKGIAAHPLLQEPRAVSGTSLSADGYGRRRSAQPLLGSDSFSSILSSSVRSNVGDRGDAE